MSTCDFSALKSANKIKVWHGRTMYVRGLILVLAGILIKSAGNLIRADFPAKVLTISGIVIFCFGLYIAMLGMGSELNKLR